MDVEFEIDYGSGFLPAPPPRNWKATAIQMSWTKDYPSASLKSIVYEWVGTNADKLNNWTDLYQPPRVRIYTCGASRKLIFQGVINLMDASASFSCSTVTAPLRKSGGIDWLNVYAKSISFSYLRDIQVIQQSDYKQTPYTITDIRQDIPVAFLAIGEFITLVQLYDTITKIAQEINILAGSATTAAAQLGTSAPTVIAHIANLILYIAYLALIIIALVNMTKALLAAIWQRKKHKRCMRYEDLFLKFCQNAGLTFQSSIFGSNTAIGYSGHYKDTTWMPRKIIQTTKNPLVSFNRPADEFNDQFAVGFPDGKVSDFFQDAMTEFNAEIKIKQNVLYFEEKNSWAAISTFQIPNTGPVGYTKEYPDPHQTNAAELAGHYKISFKVDDMDLMTINRFQGTNCEVTIVPNTVHNSIKDFAMGEDVDISFACALAKRKEFLNEAEAAINAIINVLVSVANTITSLINGLINAINWVLNLFGGSIQVPTIPQLPSNVLNNRIGWMELSGDTFAVPKTFIGIQVGADWEIHPNNDIWMSASELMKNFHGNNLATRGNQWKIYKEKEFRFCCDDFTKVENNNILIAPDGTKTKLIEGLWETIQENAVNVEYHINRNFANNLKEIIATDVQ